MRIINFYLLRNSNILSSYPVIKRKMSNMSRKIAVCQMTSIADKKVNLAVVSKLVEKAAKDEAEMIFFPEACDYILDNNRDVSLYAEPIIGGSTVNSYRQLAQQHNVWLSMGGVHEMDEERPSKSFNTHIIINNDGQIVQAYRKLHLFDVEIPEKNVRIKESDHTTSGLHVVTPVETPVGRVGLETCYDLRFPEFSTMLATLGADILAYPSAFTYITGVAHWEALLRARAVENQCFVIAAAQVGHHNQKRRSYGHAMCVDPWGVVLADCGDNAEPCYKVAELSMERLREVRTSMPVFQQRRSEIYSLYALSLRKNLLPEHEESYQDKVEVKTGIQYEGPYHKFGHVKVPESCVFYKSDLSYSFVNIRCVTPGHVLVAPIRAVERNLDLTDEEANDFYRTIRLVQKLMEKVHNTESCTVTIQDGVDAGQTVKHLHCHIMPRKKGDFIQNDLIYLELAKHDQLTATGHPVKPARSLHEMETEAEHLKDELKNMTVQTTQV